MMVEATVALKNGNVLTVHDESFDKLFTHLDAHEPDIVKIIGRKIKLQDTRQGKERGYNGRQKDL